MVQVWLSNWDLLVGIASMEMTSKWMVYRFKALSKYQFEDFICKAEYYAFLCHLVPYKAMLMAVYMDIGRV